MKAGYTCKELRDEGVEVDKILSDMAFYPVEDGLYLSVRAQIEELLREIKNHEQKY